MNPVPSSTSRHCDTFLFISFIYFTSPHCELWGILWRCCAAPRHIAVSHYGDREGRKPVFLQPCSASRTCPLPGAPLPHSHYNGSFLHDTPRTKKAKAARDGGKLRCISPCSAPTENGPGFTHGVCNLRRPLLSEHAYTGVYSSLRLGLGKFFVFPSYDF